MITSELIDRIREIKGYLDDIEVDDAYRPTLKLAMRVIDDTLIDWQIEERDRYTAKDAINYIERYRYCKLWDSDMDVLATLFNQVESGVARDE